MRKSAQSTRLYRLACFEVHRAFFFPFQALINPSFRRRGFLSETRGVSCTLIDLKLFVFLPPSRYLRKAFAAISNCNGEYCPRPASAPEGEPATIACANVPMSAASSLYFALSIPSSPSLFAQVTR